MYPGGRRGLVLGGSELTALKNSVCVCVLVKRPCGSLTGDHLAPASFSPPPLITSQGFPGPRNSGWLQGTTAPLWEAGGNAGPWVTLDLLHPNRHLISSVVLMGKLGEPSSGESLANAQTLMT